MMDRETYSCIGAECPHCGHMNDPDSDSYSLYSEDTCEWECGECLKMFNVSVYVSYRWTCTIPEPPHD